MFRLLFRGFAFFRRVEEGDLGPLLAHRSRRGAIRRPRHGGPRGAYPGPPLPAAAQAGSDASTGSEAGTHRPTFDPIGRTTAAVQLPLLGEEADVVPGPDLAGQMDVPIAQLRVSHEGLALGEAEEVSHALQGDAHHRAGPAAPAARATDGHWGLWHTGQ